MILHMVLGCVVGLVLALTGAGGGILAVPMLVLVVGLDVSDAAPIGLMAAGLAASLGAALGLQAGVVRYKAALLIAAAGIVCSPFGLWLAQRVPNRPLALGFACLLLYVAFRTFRHATLASPDATAHAHDVGRAPPPCRLDAASGRFILTIPCARALALTGTLAGTLSGLLGVSGGFVIVPSLRRYTDLPPHSVLATSLAVIALVSLSGVSASAAAGHLNWTIALPFAGGALAGMVAGRPLAARLAGPVLQKFFAALLVLVAVTMVAKAGL